MKRRFYVATAALCFVFLFVSAWSAPEFITPKSDTTLRLKNVGPWDFPVQPKTVDGDSDNIEVTFENFFEPTEFLYDSLNERYFVAGKAEQAPGVFAGNIFVVTPSDGRVRFSLDRYIEAAKQECASAVNPEECTGRLGLYEPTGMVYTKDKLYVADQKSIRVFELFI